MDEKLKEFLRKLLYPAGVKNHLGDYVKLEDNPGWKDSVWLAQAVADFTEKRVLEELRDSIILYEANDFNLKLIDQRLAALEKKGEKDGNSPSGRISKD